MKKICVITGTRAEYGLLKPLMDKINLEQDFALQVIATGMHLSPEFGLTYEEIEKDGITINKKIEILLSSDTSVGICKSMGLAMIGFSEAYEDLKPDMVIVLGDRFETFSAATSAFISRIPIAHLYGGESTYGLIDEGIRHAITKISYLHFTSTEEYRKRVIQLGEEPDRVFNVGALGLDNIINMKLLSKKELEKELTFKFTEPTALVTFHPVTLESNTSECQFKELLSTLDEFKDLKVIFTKPNADTDGRIIIKLIDEYVKSHYNKSSVYTSLGQLRYLSALKYVDLVIGNSSSGIIEVPSFGKPTVNIGDRQKGRLKAKSIIDCPPDKESIKKAVNTSLSFEFKKLCKKVKNPYGDGKTVGRIIKIIKNFNLKSSIKKEFYDVRYKNF